MNEIVKKLKNIRIRKVNEAFNENKNMNNFENNNYLNNIRFSENNNYNNNELNNEYNNFILNMLEGYLAKIYLPRID